MHKDLKCQVCNNLPFKYTHPKTGLLYCSLDCYRVIQNELQSQQPIEQQQSQQRQNEEELQQSPVASTSTAALDTTANTQKPKLKSLSGLRWPEEPDEQLFKDPLSRNDPKPFKRSQVFSLATNPKLRKLFEDYPNLKSLLKNLNDLQLNNDNNYESFDNLLEKLLGFDKKSLNNQNITNLPSNLHNVQQSDRESLLVLLEIINQTVEEDN